MASTRARWRRRLARDPDVEYAEPDRRVRRRLVPNDPRFASVAGSGPAVGQWYLKTPAGEVASSIDAVSAWDTTTGSASRHRRRARHRRALRPPRPGWQAAAGLRHGQRFGDLQRRRWPRRRCQRSGRLVTSAGSAEPPSSRSWHPQCEVSPSSWHGTQVAGIVGAATGNGTGMAGAGWNVRVLPVRVLGKCFGYTSDIIAAMRWAAGLSVPGVPTTRTRRG